MQLTSTSVAVKARFRPFLWSEGGLTGIPVVACSVAMSSIFVVLIPVKAETSSTEKRGRSRITVQASSSGIGLPLAMPVDGAMY